MNPSRNTVGRGSLPVELTRFIGREAELASLRSLIGVSRLLTLTGAGGSGKSRLALALTPQLAARAPDGVAWVELAPLENADLLAGEVLRALGAPSESGAATPESIIGVLRERSAALVLDNCEHLVDACALLVDQLLRACPGLHVLATSREALGVAGERAWLVPPLALPAAGTGADRLGDTDAVRLFIDRARDVLPDFALTPRNAAAVGAICARLDGVPLAIELAAARVRHMSVEQIHDRLSDAFALLTTGARTALPRHRTLRATLDWSHDLLPADARIVLRRLAVFRGGFTLDAVEAVVSGHSIAGADVLDLIAVLADRSLVIVREQYGSARYQLLETVRQYAALKLVEAGEEAQVRERLAGYITALVASVEPAFITAQRRAAFQALEPELDNIREALQWTRMHAPHQHVQLVGMLWWFWYSTLHWVEADQWLTEALALPAAAARTRERAALLFAAGALAALRAELERARPLLFEAAALAAALGDEQLEAYALNYIGMTFAHQQPADALEHSGRAERWFRAHDDLYGLRLALLLLGIAHQMSGDMKQARRLMHEAVGVARRFGHDRELAIALQMLASLLLHTGDAEAADPLILESLQALQRDPSLMFIARGMEYRARSIAAVDAREAARWIGAAEVIRQHVRARRFPTDQKAYEDTVTRLRATLGTDVFAEAVADGRSLSAADALDCLLGVPIAAAPGRSAEREATVATPVTLVVTESAAHEATREPTPDLLVRALGPFEAAVRGVSIDAWPYAKPKELLAYLLRHRPGYTRIAIGHALWPDASPAQVRNSFHVTLHHLRRTLGHADWIVLENERYSIAVTVSVDYDVARFEREVQAGLGAAVDPGAAAASLHGAMELYRDHFLAGEHAGAWRDDEQDRLRRMYCDAGLQLGRLRAAAGDGQGAARAYEAVIRREPFHEEAHRGLMLCWALTGRRVHALRHYERLATQLEHELELEPEPETIAIYERIRTADIGNGNGHGSLRNEA